MGFKQIKLEDLISSELILGENITIEEGAIVGYKPQRNIKDLSLYLGSNAYIRYGSVIYAGSKIGENLETGHNVVIREENQIGNNVKIWSNSVIDYGCKIGNNVRIHCNVYVAQYTVIEDNVFLAPGVMIANDKYPVRTTGWKGPLICEGARIGINTTLMPGVIIGKNCLIGAGSLVTKNIPPNSIAFGVPAKVKGAITDL